MDGNTDWFWKVVRISLTVNLPDHPSDVQLESTSNPERGGQLKNIRQIIAAVLFSRRFVLTYNAVLIFILLLAAVLHHGRIILHTRKRGIQNARAREYLKDDNGKESASVQILEGNDEYETPSSSSSSTLQGTNTPLDIAKSTVDDERKPLLTRQMPEQKPQRTISSVIKGWLMYQPQNMPLFNKVYPSNATSLGILAFLGLNMFYLFYRHELAISVFILADRAGLMFVANLPVLYFLAAKNQPLKLCTGYSYEALNIFHRRLGELMCMLALVHAGGMLGVWYTILRPLGWTLIRYTSSKIIVLGIIALFSYEILYLTSLSSFRQRCYELFLSLHIILQTVALICLFFHHHDARPYVFIAFLIFLTDRLVFRLYLKRTTIPASLRVLPDGETVLISANWDTQRQSLWHRLISASIKHGWNPTDHTFLTIPSLGPRHTLQAHPFTIASAAPLSHAWLNLLVRAQSGFSHALLTHAHRHPTAHIRLDGPYGSSQALRMLRAADLAVVVAGGSGIAVAFPLVWALLNADADPEARPLRNRGPRKVCLLWVIHAPLHREWIPEERLEEFRELGAEVLVPAPTVQVGRPDARAIVRAWVEEYCGTAESEGGGKVRVVVSGPGGMNRVIRNGCAELAGEGWDVGVAVEKFGW
ncbi:hypothetical protein M501DRAFT_926511 [Patellaria atrata CBS 101060]|uniref:FAD-binding FR-type domain-containing protein n=1 Tax=Patellaria atrata CBS 101060 TaxID=1346257 RepID=A0A9P4SHY6_9PEZI|nr:hypothetical protein M501DRAFT_926511 [Patellaria atrata CBS 101060]